MHQWVITKQNKLIKLVIIKWLNIINELLLKDGIGLDDWEASMRGVFKNRLKEMC